MRVSSWICSVFAMPMLLVACSERPAPVMRGTPSVPIPPIVGPPVSGEYPAIRCLKVELDAPETVRSEADVLVTTLTNTCGFALDALIGGMGPGFILENGAGEEVWHQPGAAFQDYLRRLPFQANEVKTYKNPWTPSDHFGEREVAPGTYELHSSLRVQRYEAILASFVDLESKHQPLTYQPAGTQ